MGGMLQKEVLNHQFSIIYSKAKYPALVAGFGCMHPDERVWTEYGLLAIKDIDRPMLVMSYDETTGNTVFSETMGSYVKGTDVLVKVLTENDSFICSKDHAVRLESGEYRKVTDLKIGDKLSLANDGYSELIDVVEHLESEYYDMHVNRTNCYVGENGFIHHNSGKSEALVLKVMYQLFGMHEYARIAVYEPTVDLIKKIMFTRFEEILGNANIKYKLNKSEQTLDIQGVGQVIFRSLDNPARIIGYEVHHSHVDEMDTLEADKAEEAWVKIMSRNRKLIQSSSIVTGTLNTISGYSTPEGYRFMYKRWEKLRLEDLKKNGKSDYELIKGRTYDNPFLPEDYITTLEESYPKHLIKAYLEGEFVNLATGTVYESFDRVENDCDSELRNDSEHLFIGMDFNVNHMSAVVACTRNLVNGDHELHIIEEIVDARDTPAMIEIIKGRYDGHPITVYPDASGRSVKSVDASKSDIALLREAGFSIQAPKKNPPIRDRIVTTNTMFCNSRGHRKVKINTKNCPTLTENLETQAYDKSGMPEKTHNVDHIIDGLGYLVHRRYALAKGKGGVVQFSIY